MVNKEIIAFIKRELSEGRSKEGIKMDLLNSDYSLREVEEAFRLLKSKKTSEEPTIKRKNYNSIIIFFLIFLVVLSVSIFLNFKYVEDLNNCQPQEVDLTIKYVGIKLFPTDLCRQLQTILIIIRINILLTVLASTYLGYLLIKPR